VGAVDVLKGSASESEVGLARDVEACAIADHGFECDDFGVIDGAQQGEVELLYGLIKGECDILGGLATGDLLRAVGSDDVGRDLLDANDATGRGGNMVVEVGVGIDIVLAIKAVID
jgi:hypothetical protein